MYIENMEILFLFIIILWFDIVSIFSLKIFVNSHRTTEFDRTEHTPMFCLDLKCHANCQNINDAELSIVQ